jgi:hypothetical protein
MADKTPVKATYSGSNVVGLAEYLTGETVPVANGGTGSTTSTGTGSVVLSASPALTGTPTAPTAAGGTNTTQIATTEFVTDAINDLIGTAGNSFDTLGELADAAGSLQTQIDLKAPIASPTFTGVPAGPTAALSTSTTQLATTEFAVREALTKAVAMSIALG